MKVKQGYFVKVDGQWAIALDQTEQAFKEDNNMRRESDSDIAYLGLHDIEFGIHYNCNERNSTVQYSNVNLFDLIKRPSFVKYLESELEK